MNRFTILAITLFMTTMCSCQLFLRQRFGIKKPEIEQKQSVTAFIQKNQLRNVRFLKPGKIKDAYLGQFPKIYAFDKSGKQVLLQNCYEMVEANLYNLVDSIPNHFSEQMNRKEFIESNLQPHEHSSQDLADADYEVYFFWSVWLGKFNVQKLQLAQNTVETINTKYGSTRLSLVPVNFDFIREDGWTKASFRGALKEISAAQKAAK